jgi:phosphohistidine phosphatase
MKYKYQKGLISLQRLNLMKTLFVLRHAKSSWDNPSLADFDRPLNDRGLAAAPFMGHVLSRKGYRPDLILSSPAERAKMTAALVRAAAGLDCPLEFDDRIYEASPHKLQKVVSKVADDKESVMIVGHNPGIEGFIKLLTNKNEPMPTASIGVIELDIGNWSEIGPSTGRLIEVLRPKEIEKEFATGK